MHSHEHKQPVTHDTTETCACTVTEGMEPFWGVDVDDPPSPLSCVFFKVDVCQRQVGARLA